SETDHRLTLIDTATNQIAGEVDVGKRPRDLVFSSDSKWAFVSAEIGGTVDVVDMTSLEKTRSIALPKGSLPVGLVITRDDQRLFVANGRGKTISEIDVATGEVVRTTEVGQRPWGIA